MAEIVARFRGNLDGRRRGKVRRAVSLLVWFVLLEGLWAMLTGTQQDTELVAGFAAAAAGAALAETLRSLGLLHFHADLRLLGQVLWKTPWQVVVDMTLVTWVLGRALARGERVRGEWLRAEFPTGGGDVGRWRRAVGVTVGSATPMAIVVDADEEGALLHSLDSRFPSGRKVL